MWHVCSSKRRNDLIVICPSGDDDNDTCTYSTCSPYLFATDTRSLQRFKADCGGNGVAAMSRLNSTLKLLYLAGDCLLILLSAAAILLSSLALSGSLPTLTYFLAADEHRKYSICAVIASSVLFLAATCCGCCGSIRQVKRKGVFNGRRILGLFQLCLVVSTCTLVIIDRRSVALRSILSEPTAFPQYDPFEKRLSFIFNDAYFVTVCEGTSHSSKSSIWFRDWIKENCPPSPSIGRHEFCAANRLDLLTCNADCEDSVAASGLGIESDFQCCPAETLCLSGVLDACPYQNCRPRVIDEVTLWLGRLGTALRAIAILSITMSILTCLLICYNPRDDIENELYKAGVFTSADVENIKRLKQEKLFTFDSRGSGSSKRTSINLDQLHERVTKVQSSVKRGRAAALGAGARAKGRRHSKISPNPSPASSVV